MSLLWFRETLKEKKRKNLFFTISVFERWIRKCYSLDVTEVIARMFATEVQEAKPDAIWEAATLSMTVVTLIPFIQQLMICPFHLQIRWLRWSLATGLQLNNINSSCFTALVTVGYFLYSWHYWSVRLIKVLNKWMLLMFHPEGIQEIKEWSSNLELTSSTYIKTQYCCTLLSNSLTHRHAANDLKVPETTSNTN